jgi:hypothetical protein
LPNDCGIWELLIKANSQPELRQIGQDAFNHGRKGAVKEQEATVKGVEYEAILCRFIPRIYRTPNRTSARDAKDTRKRQGIVA